MNKNRYIIGELQEFLRTMPQLPKTGFKTEKIVYAFYHPNDSCIYLKGNIPMLYICGISISP